MIEKEKNADSKNNILFGHLMGCSVTTQFVKRICEGEMMKEWIKKDYLCWIVLVSGNRNIHKLINEKGLKDLRRWFIQ